jgi:predicted nucleic acid-binding Zn ribbon protein
MRCCVVCNKPIEGRIHKILCSNACTIRLHRERKKALQEIRLLLLSLTDTKAIRAVEAAVAELLQPLQLTKQ